MSHQLFLSKGFEQGRLLKDLCTFGVGGPARYFLAVHTPVELAEAIALCRSHEICYLVLGRGSNCFFDDRGFNGAIIVNKIEGIQQEAEGIFAAGAGVSFALLGTRLARSGWSGLEFAAGIPGSVGGAVYMNAGASCQQTGDALVSVDYISEHGELQTLGCEQLCLGYRSSIFQKNPWAIVSARFILKKDPNARAQQLGMVQKRQSSQPYKDKSAGCIFRNSEGGAAGALIEGAGLKGMQIGDALVSLKHANFIVNTASAKSADILSLIQLIQDAVQRQYGVELRCEVRYISYEGKIWE